MNLVKEDLKKWWKEIEAWVDGKKIQYRIHDESDWQDIDNPGFFTDTEYRVKPESEFVPFDYSDAEFLIGKTVKAKDGSLMGMVTWVGEITVVRVTENGYACLVDSDDNSYSAPARNIVSKKL